MSERKHYYTDEKNAQIVIALLKAHGVRKVIANPGTTNIAFVGSVQNDPWFQVYSGVDERHSAYMAVGMAAESGEPVVLSCTGATASRNYLSALTEAYYRKLPILALTSSHQFNGVGNLVPQMIDRRNPIADTVRFSMQCPVPRTGRAEKECVSNINKALLELFRYGGGPVHINLETDCLATFNTRELPQCRVVRRITPFAVNWPSLNQRAKIAIWIGAHRQFSDFESDVIGAFVEAHNAVVLVDRTSGYRGKGSVLSALLCSQRNRKNVYPELSPDLVIQIGEVSGDYPTHRIASEAKEVWRVSEDGEARDLFNKLTYVFEMPEAAFFKRYSQSDGGEVDSKYLASWERANNGIRAGFPELPFSNVWIAEQLHDKLPAGSSIHLGILNSLRSWNFFDLPNNSCSSCNVGGFGIDGCMSAFLGASLVHPEKLYFLVIGDLAFFYDLNSLGNRHIGKNIRILLVNNGCGVEFNRYSHYGSQFGERTNDYIAAGGHNGNMSRDLVQHYSQDLGFKYFCADGKDAFVRNMDAFIDPKVDCPILFECFTTKEDESKASELVDGILSGEMPRSADIKSHLKAFVPQRVKNAVKELMK